MIVQTTGAEQHNDKLRVLLVGTDGGRLTKVASTFPNPIIASFKSDLMSIADRGIPFVEQTGTDSLLELKKILTRSPETLGFPVETLIVDTLDELQRSILKTRLKSNYREIPIMDDWMWLNTKMQQILTSLSSLDLNIVFTSHLKDVSDGETGKLWQKVGLQGGIVEYIDTYVDYIFSVNSQTVSTEDGEYVTNNWLRVAPTQFLDFLKDASGTLPPQIPLDFLSDYATIVSYTTERSLPKTKSKEVELPLTDEEKKAKEQEEKVRRGPKADPLLPSELDGPNELPEGVEANVIGYKTNLFCELCGDEVDSTSTADRAYVKHGQVMCLTDEAKANYSMKTNKDK